MSNRSAAPLSALFAWVRPRAARSGAEEREPGVRVAREQYHRTMFLVIGFWALATCVAAAVFPVAAFGVAVLGVAHVVVGHRVEQNRRDRAVPRRP